MFFIGSLFLSSLVSTTSSRTNEIRHIKWHETCKCKCRLDARVCNNKQRWNCECKCDKSCDVNKYLDYENLSVEKGW